LHTPVSYLASLPEKVQKKITVYHIARKDFPADSHLNMATFGIENQRLWNNQGKGNFNGY
jgi:hypothetical protein